MLDDCCVRCCCRGFVNIKSDIFKHCIGGGGDG